MLPTPIPPITPDKNLLEFVDIIPNHFWKDQSRKIINIKNTHKPSGGSKLKQNNINENTCPTLAPKQRAQNGIGLPRNVKLLSGNL